MNLETIGIKAFVPAIDFVPFDPCGVLWRVAQHID